MAKILDFVRRTPAPAAPAAGVGTLARDFSIEVMPKTAARVEDFRALLPAGTRVYVAHIDGTPVSDMVATARRLVDEGFAVMPHVPARSVLSAAELDERLAAYADVGVTEALVLAGGISRPHGPFSEALHLLRSGRFDARGFTRLHVAGHPEGNRDIDPDGGDTARHGRPPRQGRLRRRDRRRDGRRHPVRLRGRPGHRLGRPPRRGRHPPAAAHRRRRPRQAADAAQVRHVLRRRRLDPRAAAPRRRPHQAHAPLHPRRRPRRPRRPQGRAPRQRHRRRPLLPARRHRRHHRLRRRPRRAAPAAPWRDDLA